MAKPGPLVVLAGPTASGKTALAEELAERLPLDLLSADSQQVYRGMDIGTSKASPPARERWALLDLVDPGEDFSAGEFCRLAATACARAWERGRVPLLCGGTGLYLKALLEGLVELPQTDPALRRGLEAELAERGLEPLVRRLERVDPDLARGLDLKNPRRVLRGLEVFEGTGRPLSAWQALATRPAVEPSVTLWLGLDPGREILDARIEARVDACLRDGWVKEVERLAAQHGPEALRRSAAIGYRSLLEVCEGIRTLEDARDGILRQTRQYARRQRTWFKAQAMMKRLDAAQAAAETEAFVRSGGNA